MNNSKPWKAVAGSGRFSLVGEEAKKSEIHIINTIIIPLTYIRIKALSEKILRKHC
jgi:hypothetical protein